MSTEVTEKKKSGGVKLPEMSADEDAKWTRFFTRMARRGNRKSAAADGVDNNDDDDEDDKEEEEEVEQEQGNDGPVKPENDADRGNKSNDNRPPKKEQAPPKEKKATSDFRSLQLSLQSPDDITAVLQRGLFGESTTTPLFSEHKNLAVFFQALFSTPGGGDKKKNNKSKKDQKKQAKAAEAGDEQQQPQQQESENNNNNDEDNEQQQDEHDEAAAISRVRVVKHILKHNKPHVWTLLTLLNAWPRGIPLPSPCLKFVALCDAHGVAADKWLTDAGGIKPPVLAQGRGEWSQPVLPPSALIRALESRTPFEYFCARVEILENNKDVQKLCYRILQENQTEQQVQQAQQQQQAVAKDDDNEDDGDDDEEDLAVQPERPAPLISVLPPQKRSLLASKLASKLLRGQKSFFVSADDDEQQNSSNSNLNTIAYCCDCLDSLTASLRALTTLKKVAHAAEMMITKLGGDAQADDDEADEDEDETSSCIKKLKELALRCNGGAAEDEVALAAARQLSCVAKFKAATTVKDVNAAIDEIVDESGFEINIRGDDIISSLAVAVGALLGPQAQKQRASGGGPAGAAATATEQFADDAALEAEFEAEMRAAAPAPVTNRKERRSNAAAAAAQASKKTTTTSPEEIAALQKRAMKLLEKEIAAGRKLPRRAAAFLDRCRQELRRRDRQQ